MFLTPAVIAAGWKQAALLKNNGPDNNQDAKADRL